MFACHIAIGQTQQEKENIIVQMNYCINSLTNIVNNQSMTVLIYESDQILNNLKLTEIRGEEELQTFRTELFDAICNLQITEQEKEILSRVQDLKSKNLMWKSLSNALNPTMLITSGGKPGPQIAFQAIVAAARTAVDYQSTRGEQEIEEIQAMWELKKKELEKIGELRSNALKINFALYDKYRFLGEWDRLTEETAKKFSDIINEQNASKRVRLLKENEKVYGMLPDYYYHLGMAYLGDATGGIEANYKAARPYLNKYIEKYNRTPIFRYDQKSGIIALTKLAYEPNMPQTKKEEMIQIAIANLPNNGSALLQCALVYILELNKKEKGYQLLRSGLDNNYTNKEAILSTITFYLDDIKKYPVIYKEICSAVNDCQTIGLNEYIPFILAKSNNNWMALTDIYSIDNGPVLSFKNDRHFDCSAVKVYKVDSSGDDMHITQQNLLPEKSFSIKDLHKKVNSFGIKGNEDLMYAFVEPIIYGERYVIKKHLDYNKLRKGEFQGSNVFTLTDSDINDIVKFCEKNELKGTGLKINFKNSKAMVKQDDVPYSLLDQYYLPETIITSATTDYSIRTSEHIYKMNYKGKDSLTFIPARFESTTGNFLVIDFGNIKRTIITYKENGSSWEPFSIECNGRISYVQRQEVLDPNRDGAIIRAWNGVKEVASKATDKVGKAATTVGRWVKNLFRWVKNLFIKEQKPTTDNSKTKDQKEDKTESVVKKFIDKVKFWKE